MKTNSRVGVKASFLEPINNIDLPGDVVLTHSIAQQTAVLASWSAARLEFERVAALPSGAGYNELGLKVSA